MDHAIYILFITFLLLMNAYEKQASRKREDKLVTAVIANNVGEYAMATREMETTPKDKLKQTEAENQLVLDNQKLINDEKKDLRIPVT